MADRIFPSAKQNSLGSEKQINTIDWDAFAKNYKFAADEENGDEPKDDEMPDVSSMSDSDLESAIKNSVEYKKNPRSNMREFCEECEDDAECKPHCKEWLKRNPEEDEEEEEEEEEDKEPDTEAGYGKMSTAAKKKHPSPFIQEKIDSHKPDTDGVDTSNKNMPEALKTYWNQKNKETNKVENKEPEGKKGKKSDKVEKAEPMERKAKECNCPKGKHCEKCAEVKCESCGKMRKACACWEGGKMKKASSTEGRVIIFNHPNEISAEALMAAKNSGDDVKVRAILAARETRNRVIEAKLESLANEEVVKTQKLAQRRQYRENIIAQADNQAKRVASVQAKIAKNEPQDFKTVSAMKNDEKMIVAQRLLDNGFPKEYVEATLGLNNEVVAEVSSEETQIREIMASSLNDTTKRTAVASLVKVAELSKEQLDRCIRFWVDELGYGDEEWVRDLFSNRK